MNSPGTATRTHGWRRSTSAAIAREERSQRHSSPPQIDGCVHHWIIDTPKGPTSKARCKICRAQREFSNSSADYIRDDDSSGRGPWRRSPAIPAPPTGDPVDLVTN